MAFLRSLAVSMLCASLAACTTLRPRTEQLGEDGAIVIADSGTDGAIEDGSVDCTPALTEADYVVLAHGGSFTLTGTCLGQTTVRVATVTHTPTAGTDTTVTFTLAGNTAVGATTVSVMGPGGESNTLDVTVVHLTIEELDADTPTGNDRAQFVEVGTGLTGTINLTGYGAVLVEGGTGNTYPNTSYGPLGMTASTGLFVFANDDVMNREATMPDNLLGRGTAANAVFLVQTKGSVGTSVPFTTIPRVIDALVFSKAASNADDTALLSFAYPSGTQLNVHEAMNGDAQNQSIRRCGTTLRTSGVFSLATPTPGVANTCP